MEKAYFSQIRSAIIPYLKQAKEEVVIAMAWFTSSELFDELLNCLEKNVKVDLVLLDNAINFMDYAPDFNIFVNAGGTLRIADSSVGFMHHKFCVVDKKIAITGSYNWTYYAETRNVENIIITDSSEIVDLYLSEFKRLSDLVSVTSSSPRLSWDDIEARDDVDYRELNYEIERICEVQNKPVRKVFETKTEVIRTEIRKTPLANYDIGVLSIDENGDEFLSAFITYGTKLPNIPKQHEFFFDSKNEKELICKFLYENPNDKTERGLIKEVDLIQIAGGICDENLPVKFSMNLDDNGCFRVVVSCSKSGKELPPIEDLNQNLVKYE